jgi:hypothetical protein
LPTGQPEECDFPKRLLSNRMAILDMEELGEAEE